MKELIPKKVYCNAGIGIFAAVRASNLIPTQD
jgi:hypothetical protein